MREQDRKLQGGVIIVGDVEMAIQVRPTLEKLLVTIVLEPPHEDTELLPDRPVQLVLGSIPVLVIDPVDRPSH